MQGSPEPRCDHATSGTLPTDPEDATHHTVETRKGPHTDHPIKIRDCRQAKPTETSTDSDLHTPRICGHPHRATGIFRDRVAGDIPDMWVS
ncbi:hypothetical protein Ga0074812_10434 [Parafrankia irregularis]|uniref:Uncharacterized protein n=1 Tax=Parafrankia irregularis TaxID=795642 RepID=A0A0S4QHM1_9ACTN|nr:hypothetical protein Ga0074812_10434 [Parafrankia irregularis]